MAAYAVGMLTFDAFSFNQVTFLLFIILGLGLLRETSSGSRRRPRHRPPRFAAPNPFWLADDQCAGRHGCLRLRRRPLPGGRACP